MRRIKAIFLFFVLIFSFNVYAQRGLYEPIDLSRVHWSFDDFGYMYTFDQIPFDKLQKDFGFELSKDWVEKVQLSALKFGGGCSGSFVSANGLIMTNHHCIRSILKNIEREGENIYRDGFYAKKLKEERPFQGLYVDQLISIKDVSSLIFEVMAKGRDAQEKVKLKENKIKEIETKYSEPKKNIIAKVVTLYNGGKYSLYLYKRYDDIRLVMAPDVQITATGWDWDNFTYPRYELDFAFLRAYENGKPVKVKHYFTWSEKGAEDNELVFVIGRPGNTDRLLSVRELEFFRDVRHPLILNYYNQRYLAQYKYFIAHPDKQAYELSTLLSIANGRKYYAGIYKALRDDYIMAKKKSFESDLQNYLKSHPQLKANYGNIWQNIDSIITVLEKIEPSYIFASLLRRMPSAAWQTAFNLYYYAYHNSNKSFKEIFIPVSDNKREKYNVEAIADFLYKVKGDDCSILQSLFRKEANAYNSLKKVTKFYDKNFVKNLYESGAAEILLSEDPLMIVVRNIMKTIEDNTEQREKLLARLEIENQKLGYLIFKVYGIQIPPDATRTLRISPGFIKGYEYNGTLAPAKSTYYGMYDRFYSFGQKSYPWGLHKRWQVPPSELDLAIPMCFVSTNDIVGGNSGSAVINKNGQIVGLIHDGNLESLAGAYIFLEDDNRAIATDSWGLMEALKHVYKTEDLIQEIQTGFMPKTYKK